MTGEDNQEVMNKREFSFTFSSDMSVSNGNSIDAEEGSQNSNEYTLTHISYISSDATNYAVKQDISENIAVLKLILASQYLGEEEYKVNE